jgi:GPH family glycoside/pentoside/hexuronide:cation symporter/oligogalacturonide transporter
MSNYTKTMKKGEKGFFALADFYGGGGQALIGVLYFVFLTNVIKLQPAMAGIVTLISEIWDAISDPLMGVISDNTRTKMGRRRPYILAGGCLLAVAFALIFFPIGGNNETLKFIYCAATYLFYNTVSTMIAVSYSSMSAEISKVSEERDRANVLRLVVSTISAAVCTLLPSLVIDAYNSGKITVTAFYLIVGVGFGILFALPVILCAIFVEERVEVPESKKKFSLGEVIEPLKNRSFRQLVGMYLGQALCMDVFSAGVAMFAMYVTTPKGSTTVFLGIFIAVQLLAFPFINKLIKTTNVNKIYGFGLPLSVAALIAFAIFGSNLYVAYVCVFFVAVGFAGAQLTSWIMFPHTVDAGELLVGKRQSGGCSAIMTFARKSSSALVIFLFSLVLEFTGYNADLEIQPPSAQNGIKYVMAFTCIIFMILGWVMARRYVLSKEKNAQVEKYLAYQREGRVEELSSEERSELEALKASLK